jgi:hypothetical protein
MSSFRRVAAFVSLTAGADAFEAVAEHTMLEVASSVCAH